LKIFGLIAVFLSGGLLLINSMNFADWGDPESPASGPLSSYFIEHTIEDTEVPNIVTSVLGDYRGYDTMYETAVIFSAGLACFFLLRIPVKTKESEDRYYRHIPTGITIHIKKGGKFPDKSDVFTRIDSSWTPHDLIIKHTCRLIIPFIQIFALYVVAHGHHSPGGGFQGGVMLGASFILFAISQDLRLCLNRMKEKTAAIMGSTGVLIYAGAGFVCLLMGSNFLDYSALAPLLGSDEIMARSHGILIIETGVAIAVMAVMIWLYYNLSSQGKHDEGL